MWPEDDYSEESGGKTRGGSVKVHLPHDGVKPEDLAGQVVTIRLNPKADVVGIRKAIADNGGHCPCAIVKTEDTKCMCRDFLENMGPGECHCGLYIKEIS